MKLKVDKGSGDKAVATSASLMSGLRAHQVLAQGQAQADQPGADDTFGIESFERVNGGTRSASSR